LLLRNARQTYQRRVNALRNGVAVEAKVVEHRRTFVFWKSTRDYVAIVEVEGSRGGGMAKIQSSRAELHEQLPIGGPVIGFLDAERDQTVFLESMGYTLETSRGE